MFSSLLERSSQKIQLDRVIIKNEEQEVLLTEEKEVLNKVRSHFKKQFQKRKVGNSRIINKQIEAYRPIAKINENIYDSLSKPISIQEQQAVLKDVKNKSASGSSGISYPLIRKAGSLAQELFLALANKYIKEGDILTKQKVGQLYPILKGENQNYNLANIRPIVLLEAFRKVIV